MTTLSKIAATVVVMFGLAATPVQAGFFKNLKPVIAGAPSVTATVSLSRQTMTVAVIEPNGSAKTYLWKVSTGKAGYTTPKGSYRAKRLYKNYWSKKYDAPMYHTVFFFGGYAIHGTDAVRQLGRPASHGCIRLTKGNAAKFHSLVGTYGKWKTKIIITD